MACSKLSPDNLDIKVHFNYHGIERCALVDTSFNALYGMDYIAFSEFLKDEIPQLYKLNTLRVCFQDDEGTYIDLSSKNYHRFLRLSTFAFKSDVPKINIKVLEGASPAVSKKFDEDGDKFVTKTTTKKCLFDLEEHKFHNSYRSPVELEIDLKRKEIATKEKEFNILSEKYDTLSKDYSPNIYQDTSKSVCTKCHLRMGHTRNRCHMQECSSASICGQLDRHTDEKKELQELGKRKQKTEGELKALKSDLSVKMTLSKSLSQTFEARIHDALIRSNPSKYLTENNRPKEGVILADTYILKKYYGGRIPDEESLESESEIFQTIIKSHEDKHSVRPKNSVIRELEVRGIKWPSTQDTQLATGPAPGTAMATGYQQFLNPYWCQQPTILPQFLCGLPSGYPSTTCNVSGTTARNPLASPPPPPPLPSEDSHQSSQDSPECGNNISS